MYKRQIQGFNRGDRIYALVAPAFVNQFPGLASTGKMCIRDRMSTAPYRSPVPGKLRSMCSFLTTKRSEPLPAQPMRCV